MAKAGLPPDVEPLAVGDPVIIGRYLLLGRLGVGGMGIVFLAEGPDGLLVALKTLHPLRAPEPTVLARFELEIELSRRVAPLCTAHLVEAGTYRGRPYLVTEYIQGPPLNRVIDEQGALSPEMAYGVALGVAAALLAIHGAGLVHRDLKPGNVLISPSGPRVIDFGIARDLEDGTDGHTQAGVVMGSPGWIAPERLRGQPAVPASDIFAWACLVCYTITGVHPFGTADSDVMNRRLLLEVPDLGRVPEEIRPLIAAGLSKAPEDRPDARSVIRSLLAMRGRNPADLRLALADVLDEVWSPVGSRTRRKPGARSRYRRYAAGLAVAAAATTAVAVAAATNLPVREQVQSVGRTPLTGGSQPSAVKMGGSLSKEVTPRSMSATVRPVQPAPDREPPAPRVTVTETYTPPAKTPKTPAPRNPPRTPVETEKPPDQDSPTEVFPPGVDPAMVPPEESGVCKRYNRKGVCKRWY
ncbi:serine/threonine protein kinase [Rhizohabitans arisaemae]|uniref:serine/threonine protein kinase n=1 Tax=Rhizohabitans arisaemae TaxID=2720610 RepID=UPI0024B22E76|nr:serine/threonine protein kinase [Rhizohabitans arisaemae]